MTMSRIAPAAAGALFAFLAFAGLAEARGDGGGGGNHRAAYCLWYKQLAMKTGDEQWWSRWRLCIRGWE